MANDSCNIIVSVQLHTLIEAVHDRLCWEEGITARDISPLMIEQLECAAAAAREIYEEGQHE